jgi:hypothetical protein
MFISYGEKEREIERYFEEIFKSYAFVLMFKALTSDFLHTYTSCGYEERNINCEAAFKRALNASEVSISSQNVIHV